MPAHHFTYTPPASIDGEPNEVAELATQQVRDLAAVVGELSAATFVQLRAAGIDPDDDDAVEAWLDTAAGQAAEDMLWAAKVYIEAVNRL